MSKVNYQWAESNAQRAKRKREQQQATRKKVHPRYN